MPNIIPITDLNIPELDPYARFSEPQLAHMFEPEPGAFLAESPKVILRALDAGYEPISLFMESDLPGMETAEILKRCPDVPVYTAEYRVLTGLTGYALTRGALCLMRRRPLPDVTAILQNASRIVILENLENPTNVGAVFRNAAALGMDGVILTGDCSDPLYRRALRVSMGTVFALPWTVLPRKVQTLAVDSPLRNALCTAGFHTAAMSLNDRSISLSDPVLTAESKLAILIGNEGDGLLPATTDACDYVVKIPMQKGVDSLNAAAASAVAFWQLGHSNGKE